MHELFLRQAFVCQYQKLSVIHSHSNEPHPYTLKWGLFQLTAITNDKTESKLCEKGMATSMAIKNGTNQIKYNDQS